ncbi:hypothetical protein NM688_g1040 [Phlebia brevispora]|uniref:Uncharacterized protein n=1 Tax=Phlebia brevispora TaxID=194682 RepID=A0ACC1TDD5_9APHY|nr:hypothetical protein NM688_g1040 [Phlebia brevispora]
MNFKVFLFVVFAFAATSVAAPTEAYDKRGKVDGQLAATYYGRDEVSREFYEALDKRGKVDGQLAATYYKRGKVDGHLAATYYGRTEVDGALEA